MSRSAAAERVDCPLLEAKVRDVVGLDLDPPEHASPTSGSWLNLVEVFFAIITRPAIGRGSFDSVEQLVAAIRACIDAYNERCQRFIWTKSADAILAHATRQPTSDAGH